MSVILALATAVECTEAGLCRSKPAYTGDWADVNTWIDNVVPVDGDDVTITNAGSVVILSSGSSNLNSLLVDKTLIFTNWNTILKATEVTVASNGALTLPGPFSNNIPSNNIYIVCTNLVVMNTGQIYADGKGYAGGNTSLGPGGYGPGGSATSTKHGASHGGMGGGDTTLTYPPKATYGEPVAPVAPGSGGGWWNGPTSHGGGAIRIEASATVTVYGVISANAVNNADNQWGGGSGGSVWINCGRIVGTGLVTANGGSGSGVGGNGGGGRVAIDFDPVAQQGPCGISFRAQQGIKTTQPAAYPGTLWFSDTTIMPDSIAPSQFWGVVVSGSGAYGPFNSFTISNTFLRFATGTQEFYITNNLLLTQNGILQLGGEMFGWNKGYFWYATNMPTLTLGGNLIVETNAYLNIYCAESNGVAPYGAAINIGNSITVRSNAAIYCWSHYTNGGSAMFTVGGDVTVDATSAFNADYRGYASYAMLDNSGLRGYGPGGGLARSGSSPWIAGGASHGGTAAWNSRPEYGSSNAPIMAGSGGGGDPSSGGGRGGGVVRIRAGNRISVDGSITARGYGWASGQSRAGGSGGSIYLICHTFAGTGSLNAAGGDGYGDVNYRGYGGAGGRIAVWRVKDTTGGVVHTNVSGGAYLYPGNTNPYAQAGTVVWIDLPAAGSLIMIQ